MAQGSGDQTWDNAKANTLIVEPCHRTSGGGQLNHTGAPIEATQAAD